MNNVGNKAVNELFVAGGEKIANQYKDSAINGINSLSTLYNTSGAEIAHKAKESAINGVKNLGYSAKDSVITTVKDTGKFILGINNIENAYQFASEKKV